jgi:hypothetical protein
MKDEAMVICDGVLTEGGAKITLPNPDCLTHPAPVSTTILFPHGTLPCGTKTAMPCSDTFAIDGSKGIINRASEEHVADHTDCETNVVIRATIHLRVGRDTGVGT